MSRPRPVEARREGLRLLAAGRFVDAVPVLLGALPAYRDDGAFRADLGLALRETGRLDEALAHLLAAGALLPDNADVALHLGVSLRRAGRLDEALAALRRAVDLAPGAGQPQLDLGDALVLAGRPEEAEAAYRGALACGPHPGASYALANLLMRRGAAPEAAGLLTEALAHHPQVEALWSSLLGALSAVPPAALAPSLRPYLLSLLRRPGLDHQRLLPHVVEEEAGSPLLLAFLRVAAPSDPGLERRLIALRQATLDEVERAPLPLVEALAMAVWHTEGCWPLPRVALREDPRLAALQAALLGASDPGQAALLPLFHQRCGVEPAAEAALAPEIPVVALAEDAVSAAVSALYEGSPYPRLATFPRPLATTLTGHLGELFPGRRLRSPAESGLRILVAGCGAGTQPLGVALRHPHASVLGIDLSRASLARARRLAAGQRNLSFAQADILALCTWGERFDVIECGGVLHHLDEPLRGWRTLAGLLRPRGLMKIALYSARARTEIDAGRALHAALGLSTDAEGLRSFRAAVLDLPADHPAALLRASPDFYSLTGLRDLVFHPCERRFSPRSVGESVQALGLDWIGFQFADARVPARFVAEGYGALDDIEAWERFEADHPRAFAGMMCFWCQAR